MPQTKEITNSEDIIDSRDVIARISDLEDQEVYRVISLTEKDDEGNSLYWSNADGWVDIASADTFQPEEHASFSLPVGGAWECDLSDDELAELANLRKLAEQGEGYCDWTHGETLIRDSYFEDYARDLADDLGSVKSDAQWPYTCIDWEQAARELQMDYTSIDFDGIDYWVRS